MTTIDMKTGLTSGLTPLCIDLYTKIVATVEKEHLFSSGVTITDVIPLAVVAMKIIEKFQHVSGAEKKEAVITVVKHTITKQLPDDESRLAALAVMDAVLPAAVDAIISVDKGEVKIAAKRLFSRMKSCCS